MRDVGPTEVGAFAISDPKDLLLITDLLLIKQQTTAVTVAFDDVAVADHFDAMVDQGRKPEECGRIWVHTHPGHSAEPSGTDEATFTRCFGSVDWAVMFILARGGQTYARLRFRAGPGGDLLLPVGISYQNGFSESAPSDWYEEYLRCVEPLPTFSFERATWADPGAKPLNAISPEDWHELEEYHNPELSYGYDY